MDKTDERILCLGMAIGFMIGLISTISFNLTPNAKWYKASDSEVYVCSECSFESEEPYEFCPNCGYIMSQAKERKQKYDVLR